MGLVICHLETGEQIDTCYLYTLMNYIEIKHGKNNASNTKKCRKNNHIKK